MEYKQEAVKYGGGLPEHPENSEKASWKIPEEYIGISQVWRSRKGVLGRMNNRIKNADMHLGLQF